MRTITLDHLNTLLSRPAFTRCPRVTYSVIKQMYNNAVWAAERAFENEDWNKLRKYTAIQIHLLGKMVNHSDKFVNVEK